MSAGTRVLWPAAKLLTPTTWTSLSIACLATSYGVANRPPTSTSKPISANPLAITFAPLSCPSYPIFATRILGFLPSFLAKFFTIFKALSKALFPLLPPFVVDSELYAPLTMLSFATCLPYTSSRAWLISPTVALAFAACTPISRRFPCFDLAQSDNCFNISFTFWLSLYAFTWLILAICLNLTSEFSICLTSKLFSSFYSLYLLTPTIVSAPESILACLLAALSSIRSLGIPDTIAYVIPPISSTSFIIFSASLASSFVSDSIINDPAQGSATWQIPLSS